MLPRSVTAVLDRKVRRVCYHLIPFAKRKSAWLGLAKCDQPAKSSRTSVVPIVIAHDHIALSTLRNGFVSEPEVRVKRQPTWQSLASAIEVIGTIYVRMIGWLRGCLAPGVFTQKGTSAGFPFWASNQKRRLGNRIAAIPSYAALNVFLDLNQDPDKRCGYVARMSGHKS